MRTDTVRGCGKVIEAGGGAEEPRQSGEYSRRSFAATAAVVCSYSDRGAVEDVLRCFGKVAAREKKAVGGSEEEIEMALIGIVADGDNPRSS